MVENDRTIVPAGIDGGPDILIEVRMGGAAEEDVAGEIFKFENLTESIQAVAEKVSRALDKVRPDRAAVEFGIDAGVSSTGLTALVAKGTANATIKVTLEWGRAPEPNAGGA